MSTLSSPSSRWSKRCSLQALMVRDCYVNIQPVGEVAVELSKKTSVDCKGCGL
jgi:hypothetical protein